MNERQKRFANEYLITGNIYNSAIKAGYSEKYAGADACKILDNPSVKGYLQECTRKIDSKKIAQAEEVLEFLTKCMRMEVEEDVINNGITIKKK